MFLQVTTLMLFQIEFKTARNNHPRPLLIKEGSPEFPLLAQEGLGVVGVSLET